MSEKQKPKTDPEQKPNEPKTDDATEANKAKGGEGDERKFTQAELDAAIKERLARATKKAEEEAAAAAQKAQDDALAKNKEFEALAETRGKSLEEHTAKLQDATADLEAVKARCEALETVIAETVKTEVDALGLPDAVKALLDKMSPLEQREWLVKNGPELAKQKPSGAPPTPRRDADATKTTSEEDKRKADQDYARLA